MQDRYENEILCLVVENLQFRKIFFKTISLFCLKFFTLIETRTVSGPINLGLHYLSLEKAETESQNLIAF